ncbi:MAG TPA: hypothetical protein VG435_14300 [Acidimicrobiales bacterium]|jgi:hypothetical protein|nr:hypothetical protein [Acidimicrobiales bacterium]
MVSNLPEPVRGHRQLVVHPSLVRAAVSPTAVAVTAAGAGIGVLDHSLIVGVILAAVGWTGRMGAAVLNRRRKDQAAAPKPATVDPWSVPEPWRQLLTQAAAAQSRFQQTVAGWAPGPTRDRLVGLQPRVFAEVAALTTMAHQGAAAMGWTGATFATGRPAADRLTADLQQVQAERRGLGEGATVRASELVRREEAIAAQLRAVRHGEQAAAEIQDRLRLAVARLDETVTDLVAAQSGAAAADPGGLTSALDELSDGVVSLRLALSETAGLPPDTQSP